MDETTVLLRQDYVVSRHKIARKLSNMKLEFPNFNQQEYIEDNYPDLTVDERFDLMIVADSLTIDALDKQVDRLNKNFIK